MWTLRGQQVQIPTHGQNERAYGIGAVNYHTGETVMITRAHKRKGDVAAMLRTLIERHATGRIYVTWDNTHTHYGGEIATVLKEANGRLILL
jgi:putative transposase